MIGYSLELAKENRQANARHPGVKLGRLCIQHGIPISKVADICKVSRVTVYNWFRGVVVPSKSKMVQLEALLSKLQAK